MCARPAARRASLIMVMEFTIDSCVLHVSKDFLAPELGDELVCHRKEGDPNGVYTIMVVVETGQMETVQINHNDLYSFSHISSTVLSLLSRN